MEAAFGAEFMTSSRETDLHLAETLAGDPRAVYVDELGPGEELDGRYRIIRRIGSGGMGTVYAAEQIKLRRRVAIKLIHPERATRRKHSHRFLREAQAASCVAHPGVVDILDFGELPGGIHYLVMELLEGQDLSELLEERGTLEWPRARQILLQILRGLQAAHDNKIIHRDIKPANIFLLDSEDENGPVDRVKVLDFGIARFEQDTDTQKLTGTAEMLGTVSYMAPEVALNKPATVQSDLYAVGILAYEILTGSTPFQGEGPLQMMYAQIHESPPRLRSIDPGISRAVEAVIMRVLAKDPAERFEGAQQFEQALLEIDDEGKRIAPSLAVRLHEFGAWRLMGIALVFLLLVGLTGAAWVQRDVEPVAVAQAPAPTSRAPSVLPEAEPSHEEPQGGSSTGSSTDGASAGSSSGGSSDGAPEITVHFDNQLRWAVELSSTDEEGVERVHATVAPGETLEAVARLEQRWLVRSTNGRVLRDEVIEHADQRIVLERARKSGSKNAQPVPESEPTPPSTVRDPKPSHVEPRSTRSTAEHAARTCGKRNQSFFTRVEVELQIASDGRVTQASVRAPLRGTPVGSCVAKALAKLRFPSAQGGQRKVWTLSL